MEEAGSIGKVLSQSVDYGIKVLGTKDHRRLWEILGSQGDYYQDRVLYYKGKPVAIWKWDVPDKL